MPHRAKAREDIERQIAEMRDMVETCNLAPYKKKEYEDKIKKLQDLLPRQRKDSKNGFALADLIVAVLVISIAFLSCRSWR